MATIRKRGRKWQVQVRRKGFPPMSRSFQRKADASTWARHMETEADRQNLPADPRVLRSVTVGQIMARYRDTVTVNKRGCRNETIILNALLRLREGRPTPRLRGGGPAACRAGVAGCL